MSTYKRQPAIQIVENWYEEFPQPRAGLSLTTETT